MCGEFFFFQAEDGIRDLVRSRGLGDVYKRQAYIRLKPEERALLAAARSSGTLIAAIAMAGLLPLSLIHI